MAKRTRVIRRIYEKGREKVVFSAGKPSRPRTPMAKPAVGLRPLAAKPHRPPTPSATKRIVTRPQPAGQPFERPVFAESYELPSHYGVTYLRLMVKDPFWIYAYWEIAPGALNSLMNKLSGGERESAKVILRMYEVSLIEFNGSNANHYFDIEVGPNANNWYVNLWNDSVSYVGEIGIRTYSGMFLPLARSNYVQTPRLSYSPRTEQMWMNIPIDRPRRTIYVEPTLEALADKRTSSAKMAAVRSSKIAQKAAARSSKIKVYLTEEDIRNFYSRLSPRLRDIISTKLSRFCGARAGRFYGARAGRFYGARAGRYKITLEGEREEERQRIFSLLPKGRLVKRIRLGSSEELIFMGASEQLVRGPGGASEFAQDKRQRRFFFELATELIVYGRTEPDAEVLLANRKIKLNQDGTFSMRFALADGKIPLEFKAISKDKNETRKISTYVQRSTHSRD